jgi:WD40 repeat protein
MATSSLDGRIKIWDCTNASLVSEVLVIDSTDPVSALGVTSCQDDVNTVIVSGTTGGSVYVRDIRFLDGLTDKAAKADPYAITSLLLGRNYDIVTGDANGNVNVWDMRSMRNLPILTFNSHSECSMALAGTMEQLPPVSATKRRVEISEDIWEVAMGKRKSMRTEEKSFHKPMKPDNPTLVAKAHSGRVLACGFVQSCSVATVSEDKSIRVFCMVTGRLLHSTKMKEKPTCAVLDEGILCFGTRSGFEITKFIDGQWAPPLKNDGAHVGSVTAVDFVGEWGLCTGGTDRHLFIHKINS